MEGIQASVCFLWLDRVPSSCSVQGMHFEDPDPPGFFMCFCPSTHHTNKQQDVFVKFYARAATKAKKYYFSPKITRSSTLVSFEMALLVEF